MRSPATLKTSRLRTSHTMVAQIPINRVEVKDELNSLALHNTRAALQDLLKLYDRVTTGKDGGYGVKEVLRLNEIRELAQ